MNSSLNNISNENLYTYEIITDPDDPSIREDLDQLLSLIETNEKISMIETNLDRGLVKYDIYYYSHDLDQNTINIINELRNKVSYFPVTLTANISKFSNSDIRIGFIITEAREMIKIFTERLLNIDIKDVNTITLENDIIVFSPITDEGDAVYENPSYLSEYYRVLNLDILFGYQVLSENPICKYVLSELYKSGEFVPTDLNIISVNGVLVLPVGYTDDEQDHYTKMKDRIISLTDKYDQDGYFFFELGIHNLSDKLIIEELTNLWNTDIVYSDDTHIILKSSDLVDFGTLPELWFQNNIDTVKRGEFPSITLYGEWQRKVGGDYNEVYGKPWNYAIIHYGALLSYRRLGLEDPFIQPFTHTTKINNDLSITISVPTYSHVLKFKEYLNEILNGYFDKDMEHFWYVEPCKDLLDGVIKRWYVQSIDKKALAMVLKQVYSDGKSDEILIYRSPAVALDYNKNSPLNLDNIKMDDIRNRFQQALKDYYMGLCHGNMEPVTLDDIVKMDLSQLLNLIEIKENNTTYCYETSTLLNLNPAVSPMTRQPIHDNVLIKSILLEWGLRGLFDIGPVTGLYSDYPNKILVSPKNGVPMIVKEEVNDIVRQVTGDIYSVSVGFSDGTITDLFEIATENPNELKKLVNDLWNKGAFLSYSTSALEKYGTLQSYSVIVLNPLLRNGSNSKNDGQRAMDYLKVLNQ